MVKYSKCLVGKDSPDNLCFTRENELLVVASKGSKMKGRIRKGDHFFLGVESSEPTQYGWVKTLEAPITAEELARLKWESPSLEDIGNCELLLSSASKQPDGTPMASHFVEIVAPEGKKKSLSIHKVIFYQDKSK